MSAFVPELSAKDVHMLVASGISDPNELAETSPEELQEWLQLFIASDDGNSFSYSDADFDLPRMRRWIESARRNRDRWRGSRAYRSHNSRSSSSSRSRRDQKRRSRSNRTSRRDNRHESSLNARSQRSRDRSPRAGNDSGDSDVTRFHLNVSDEVQNAPSIGSRMAGRLAKVSVHTVSDLLSANPTELATRLNFRRVNADTVRQWQHQARLAIRVPNLRGHDTQLLTGCEITSPEQLAAMNPTTLLERVQKFAKSKEGKRILRGGDQPNFDEVSDWIAWASRSREGKAA